MGTILSANPFGNFTFPPRQIKLPLAVLTVITYPMHTMRAGDIVRCMEYADGFCRFRGLAWLKAFDAMAVMLGYQYSARAVCRCEERCPQLGAHLPECGFVRNDIRYSEEITDEPVSAAH